MHLFGWFRKQQTSSADAKLGKWRRQWQAAVTTADPSAVAALATELDSLGLSEDETEIEREMLDGLTDFTQLRGKVDAGQFPIVQTGHRVVGTDICHFSTPCSMPDDPAQPSGRLIFTAGRVIFAGGARALTIPWHMVADVVQQERDVALVRHDRETFYRFRCNNYSDALCGGLLARTLSARPRTRQS
jgi:hypothetical protein